MVASPSRCRRRLPRDSHQALLDQNDLQSVPGAVGVQVFRNPEAIPVTAERARPVASTGQGTWPGPARCGGLAACPQRPGGPYRGDRCGHVRHRLRRIRPGRKLLADPERPGRSPASRCSAGPGSIRRFPRDLPRCRCGDFPSARWACSSSCWRGWYWHWPCSDGPVPRARRRRKEKRFVSPAHSAGPVVGGS